MSKIKLPDWTKRLPNDACIRLSELKIILGYSESSRISKETIFNNFGIKPVDQAYKHSRQSKGGPLQYKISDLRDIEKGNKK